MCYWSKLLLTICSLMLLLKLLPLWAVSSLWVAKAKDGHYENQSPHWWASLPRSPRPRDSTRARRHVVQMAHSSSDSYSWPRNQRTPVYIFFKQCSWHHVAVFLFVSFLYGHQKRKKNLSPGPERELVRNDDKHPKTCPARLPRKDESTSNYLSRIF